MERARSTNDEVIKRDGVHSITTKCAAQSAFVTIITYVQHHTAASDTCGTFSRYNHCPCDLFAASLAILGGAAGVSGANAADGSVPVGLVMGGGPKGHSRGFRLHASRGWGQGSVTVGMLVVVLLMISTGQRDAVRLCNSGVRRRWVPPMQEVLHRECDRFAQNGDLEFMV